MSYDFPGDQVSFPECKQHLLPVIVLWSDISGSYPEIIDGYGWEWQPEDWQWKMGENDGRIL